MSMNCQQGYRPRTKKKRKGSKRQAPCYSPAQPPVLSTTPFPQSALRTADRVMSGGSDNTKPFLPLSPHSGGRITREIFAGGFPGVPTETSQALKNWNIRHPVGVQDMV